MTDLPVLLLQLALQPGRVRKQLGVPGEAALPVCVFDIQPHDIVRDVVVVKLVVHLCHSLLGVIVPARMVVAQGEQRRQGMVP